MFNNYYYYYNNVGTADGVTAHTESAAVPVLNVRNHISVAAALVSEKVQEALWIH